MNRWEKMEAMEFQDIRPPCMNEVALFEIAEAYGSIAVSKKLWDEKIKGPKKPPRTDYSAVISLVAHFKSMVYMDDHLQFGIGCMAMFGVNAFVPDLVVNGEILSWNVKSWICQAYASEEEWQGKKVKCLTLFLPDEPENVYKTQDNLEATT